MNKTDIGEEFVDLVEAECELVCKMIEVAEEEDQKPLVGKEGGDEDGAKQDKEKKPSEKAEALTKLLKIAAHGDCEEKAAPGWESMQSSAENVKDKTLQELKEWKENLENRSKRLKESSKYMNSVASRILADIRTCV